MPVYELIWLETIVPVLYIEIIVSPSMMVGVVSMYLLLTLLHFLDTCINKPMKA